MPAENDNSVRAVADSRPADTMRRASIGRVLVAVAVFLPALLILVLFLGSQGQIYGYHLHGSKWPWIVADIALLLVGTRMMRGEDL